MEKLFQKKTLFVWGGGDDCFCSLRILYKKNHLNFERFKGTFLKNFEGEPQGFFPLLDFIGGTMFLKKKPKIPVLVKKKKL